MSIPARTYRLYAFPLEGTDAAPVRAVLETKTLAE
jgi:kynurenine formamidase